MGMPTTQRHLKKTLRELQETLNRIIDFLSKLGLELNASKCKVIQIIGSKSTCGEEKKYIGSEEVPNLKASEAADYLGKPVGYRLFPNENKIDKFIEGGVKILTSSLAPWQKIDAMKTFFYPSLSHAMRTAQHGKDSWARLDKDLRKHLKEVLGLPKEANRGYLIW